MPSSRRQRGLSLVELMVALVIGLILVLGLVEVFGASRAAYQLSEGMGRAQENGRFAIDFLQRDIRMAGHFGCVNDQARRLTDDAFNSHFGVDGALDFGYSIRGYEDASPDDIDLSPERIDGTDTLVLRFLRGNGAPILTVDTSNPAAPFATVDPAKWSVLQDSGVASPEMFGVADCAYADVFSADAVDAASGKVTAPAGVDLGRYGTSPGGGPAMLYRAEVVVYYIGLGAGGQPSLWRARLNGDGDVASEELVEGIENLQLRYGMDRNDATDPTGFMDTQGTADDVGDADLDWRAVGQVQVALLAASPAPAAAAQASQVEPNLLGEAVDAPDDGRYRAVYETTIALRNRLYGN
ncbi:pilus assembly protein PilW [Pseudoxanthomonas jiangsuensis]|uniref:PilW family protein n=1 Tax=Pseudoxanthomonas jiangsuensis TaxID=619688 RepID=UPI001391B658|nr:PilW family protein [Pseudoxanthomonas jiangsuensis]KAF1698445.1 pilus assembly protein PilW [Pseudoxanthomonas jiangsuensis]